MSDHFCDAALLSYAALDESVAYSLQVLREHAGDLPYWGAFSGGKDSVCIKQLCIEAGVAVDWHYGVTSIDPPELVRFIHEVHPDVRFLRSKTYNNFGDGIARAGLPGRIRRWCCAEFKERPAPNGRTTVVGIRAEESPRRRKSWNVWNLKRKKGAYLCPILHWTEADVWEYIESRNLPYCSLYDEGYARLGCVGCPMQPVAQRRRDLERWPQVKRMLLGGTKRLMERMMPKWKANNQPFAKFSTPEELFDWWLTGKHV